MDHGNPESGRTTAAGRLYVVLDLPHPSGRTAADVARAVCRGARGLYALQLRMKDGTTAERVRAARAMGEVAAAFGVPLFVNDDADAALSAGAAVDGLHVGQEDTALGRLGALRREAAAEGRRLRVGISTHDMDQLRAAAARSPDYLAFGPVRPTRSKARPDPVVGFSGLAQACRASRLPVVAIGGLRPQDGPALAAAGAAAAAVIGAVEAPDLAGVTERTRALAAALAAAYAPWPLARVEEAVPVLSREVLAELAHLAEDAAALRGLGLPLRFRPIADGGDVRYRPSDVADLLWALDKDPGESWAAWRARHPAAAPLLQIRRP